VLPTVTPADIKHRQEFKDFVIAHADAVYKPILRQLYGLWEAYTKELLKEPMIPPYIMLSSPSRPQALGDFSPVSGFGGHSQIMIRPTLLTGHHKVLKKGARYAEGRFLFVADVLLHETIHQYHQEVTGETEESYKGHGPNFRDTCNEIGEHLRLLPVRVAKARGPEKDLPSCAYWPHCVRPAGYYKGAFVTSEDQDRASDIDAEDETDRSAAQANLEKERSATLIALVDAVRNFRRVWPGDTDETVANIMPSLDRTDRRRLMAFLRAARDLDIGL
jgi:hypothetical protein